MTHRKSYTTKDKALARGRAGRNGLVFDITVKSDPRLRILDWQVAQKLPEMIDILARAETQKRDIFELLERDFGVDIVLNGYVLLQNQNAIDFGHPSLNQILLTWVAVFTDTNVNPIDRLRAVTEYTNLRPLALAAGEKDLGSYKSVKVELENFDSEPLILRDLKERRSSDLIRAWYQSPIFGPNLDSFSRKAKGVGHYRAAEDYLLMNGGFDQDAKDYFFKLLKHRKNPSSILKTMPEAEQVHFIIEQLKSLERSSIPNYRDPAEIYMIPEFSTKDRYPRLGHKSRHNSATDIFEILNTKWFQYPEIEDFVVERGYVLPILLLASPTYPPIAQFFHKWLEACNANPNDDASISEFKREFIPTAVTILASQPDGYEQLYLDFANLLARISSLTSYETDRVHLYFQLVQNRPDILRNPKFAESIGKFLAHFEDSRGREMLIRQLQLETFFDKCIAAGLQVARHWKNPNLSKATSSLDFPKSFATSILNRLFGAKPTKSCETMILNGRKN